MYNLNGCDLAFLFFVIYCTVGNTQNEQSIRGYSVVVESVGKKNFKSSSCHHHLCVSADIS